MAVLFSAESCRISFTSSRTVTDSPRKFEEEEEEEEEDEKEYGEDGNVEG